MRSRSVALAALLACAPFALADGPGAGQPLAPDAIPFFATYVLPDGTGLPPGRGDALGGAKVWASACAACHGVTGNEGPIQPPVGPADGYPKPAGRYWPYATTLFDYIRRAMPFTNPKSLSDDEVYAVTAYVLHRNGIIGATDVMDAEALPKVAMPNRGNFVDGWTARQAAPR